MKKIDVEVATSAHDANDIPAGAVFCLFRVEETSEDLSWTVGMTTTCSGCSAKCWLPDGAEHLPEDMLKICAQCLTKHISPRVKKINIRAWPKRPTLPNSPWRSDLG